MPPKHPVETISVREYSARQTIPLSPVSLRRPVVLFYCPTALVCPAYIFRQVAHVIRAVGKLRFVCYKYIPGT